MLKQKFSEQKGAATMNPSKFRRWLTSKLMSRVAKRKSQIRLHEKAERNRILADEPHVLEYFHQVDDPYSWLAVQTLQPLLERYNIDLINHLVSGPTNKNLPEPSLLKNLATIDAGKVAPHYGLETSESGAEINKESIWLANKILTASISFASDGSLVSSALTKGNLNEIATEFSLASDSDTEKKLSEGNSRLSELSHYSGAMFFYGDEWYWGVDRLYLLEDRWRKLGLDKSISNTPLFARPAIEVKTNSGVGCTLEFYASLRSPYTALIFDHVVKFARASGLTLELKPVLPMVMRGVSLTRQKGLYIFADAAREARALGDELGPFWDPIGEPVRLAYSLYPWAKRESKHVEFFSAFLSAAFREGVNTMTTRGIKHVLQRADLDWNHARSILGQSGWEDELETNRLDMYSFGSWGVPSFRLLNSEGKEITWAWGQDRLWFIAKEILRINRW